jgi:SRSO17 transposase
VDARRPFPAAPGDLAIRQQAHQGKPDREDDLSLHRAAGAPGQPRRPRHDDGHLPERWLLAEWPPHEAEPTDYWLFTLPADIRLQDLVRLAKIRWRIEHDYRAPKTGLGWHRHVTLASAAYLFRTECD